MLKYANDKQYKKFRTHSNAQVADFGLSRTMTVSNKSSLGVLKGTMAYCAPEVSFLLSSSCTIVIILYHHCRFFSSRALIKKDKSRFAIFNKERYVLDGNCYVGTSDKVFAK